MQKDHKKVKESGHKTKYLHTFFPQINNEANQKTGSLQHLKQPLSFSDSTKGPETDQIDKMVLQKPSSFWGGIPLGSRNILEEKLQESRVKDQLQEEARQERLNKEKGWFTDAKESATSIKQDNDPWYTADIWGDDLSAEAIEECILLASNSVSEPKDAHQKSETNPSVEMILREDENSFLNCLEELSALDNCASDEITKYKIDNKSTKTSFNDYKVLKKPERPVDKSTSETERTIHPGNTSRVNTHSLGVQKYLKSMKQNVKPQWEPVVQKSKPFPLCPENKNQTSKENAYNNLSKLSLSQRKLEKPTRSMPSSSSQAFTTEWLRNQLEKVNVEYNVLKENMQTKDGESKLLREKLRLSQQQLEKIKQDKADEMETLKKTLEAKVKELEKKLESTKTQMLFKAKETESSFGKFNKRKVSSDRTSSVDTNSKTPKASLDVSFKKFMTGENRPGEIISQTQTVLADSSDLMDLSTSGEHRDVSNRKTSCAEKQPASIPRQEEKNLVDQGDIDMFNDDDSDMMLNTPCLDNLISLNTGQVRGEDVLPRELNRLRRMVSMASDPNEEFISAITEELKACLISQKKKIRDDFVKEKGPLLSIMLFPEIEEEVPPEMNFVIPPMQPYLCRKVLFNDVNEQPAENYKMTRPTLKEVWQTPLEGFIPAKKRTTDRLHKFEEVPLEPALADVLLSSGRFFTPLAGCIPLVLQLIDCPVWDWSIFDTIILKILEHVRKMAVEIYVAVGDPRRRAAMVTVRDREESVINECLDYAEMSKKLAILSAQKWKDEVHIDMRRGLGIITQICALDYRLIVHLFDPRILTTARSVNPFSKRGRMEESMNNIGRKGQLTDRLVNQCTSSNKMSVLTERKKYDSVPVYVDTLMKKWNEHPQPSSCCKEELDEIVQFELYLNDLIPLPEETEDSFKSRVAMKYVDGLSDSQLHLLNKKVEELLIKGAIKPRKLSGATQEEEGHEEKDKLISDVAKNDCEIPNKPVLLEEGTTSVNKDELSTKKFVKKFTCFDFSSYILKQQVKKQVPCEEEIIPLKKIIGNVDERGDDVKRVKHEIVTKPVENKLVPISSRLLETPKPQWEVAVDNSIAATNNLEILNAEENVCVSCYEQEFIEKIFSNVEQLKSVVEETVQLSTEDDNNSNSVKDTSAVTKRKFVDSGNDSDCADHEEEKNPKNVRGSPPAKKRDVSLEALKEGAKAGPSSEIQTSVVADVEPPTKDVTKRDISLEAVKEVAKAGTSSEIQTSVAADVEPPTKDVTISKGWKKEVFKKADIAPLKNTTRVELSDNAQEALNKEMEMEIDKLFDDPPKVSSEKKVIEIVDLTSSKETPATEPTTSPVQKMEDENLAETSILKTSFVGDKDPNANFNVKVPTLEECMEKFHKKIKTAGLLEILYEIIKVAGELRYSWKFNALMAAFAHLMEVMCDSPVIIHLPSSSTKIATILREILYSRPSPIVVNYINRCLTKAVKLNGFIKTLCHNSDPETFVKFEDDVYFKRGSCMLQTLCLLMDITIDDTCWDAPYELIRWVNFVLTEEKITAKTWFELKNGFRVKRCFCLQALTNLVVKILHRSVTFYVSRLALLPDENFSAEFQLKMEEILHAGLEIVGEMVNIDIVSFVRSIRTSYHMYEKFLEQLESIHLENDTFASFKLTPNNFHLLQKLLSTRKISKKILEETDVKRCAYKKSQHQIKENPPDLSTIYKNNKSWPSDRFKPEAQEENNEEEWTLW